MELSVFTAAGVVCIAGLALQGQGTYPFISELRQNYTIAKRLARLSPRHDRFAGAQQAVNATSRTTKADRRERSKLGLLAGMISHSHEQYGYMAVYLRLKDMVPPSSE